MIWKTIFRFSALLSLAAALSGAAAAADINIKKEPENYAQGAVNLGWAAFRRGDLDGSLEYFGRAIQLDPKWAVGYYGKAYVYSEREEFELAFDYYRKAIEFEPNFAEAHRAYAIALVSAKRPREALPLLQKALSIAPESGQVYAALALCWYSLGKYAKAWESVHQAQDLKTPVSEPFLQNLRARMPDPRLNI